jgi:hypothetical protein
MAINFSGVNAWADETSEALNFYTDAVMGNTVVPWVRERGTLLTGVKANSIKLPTLGATSVMQDGDNCTFNADGTITVGQTTLLMKNIKFQDLLCARTMEDYFTAVTLPAGQNYTSLGQAENAMLMEVMKAIQKNLANGYFNETTLFDGWIQQLYDAFGINAGTTTPTAGGSAGTDAQGVFNIVNTLVRTWMADEDLAEVVQNGTASIVMCPLHISYYFENLAKLKGDNGYAQAQLSALAGGAQSFVHEGTNVRIYSQAALTASKAIILSRDGNFTLGFDLEGDNTNLRVGLDQYEENIYYTLRTKLGTGFRGLNANNVLYWGVAS